MKRYFSNNNNNNNDNINFQQSSNTVVTGNINVANQINVMNMVGRKKRAGFNDYYVLKGWGNANQLNVVDCYKVSMLSSGISSCVRTVDMVMYLHMWRSSAV